jgi:RNA polymerase sigma-70 factor (ECF subfamily)
MPDLLSYFIRRLDDREDAADALSETLVVLWRKSASLPQGAEDRRKYAFGIARKVLAATRRGALKHAAIGDALREQLARQPEPSAVLDGDLATAIRRLPAKDRELLLLVTWEGFGVAEAGSILGLRPANARARYSRLRARLRELLAPADD